MSSRYSKKKKHSKDERIPTQWSGWEWKEDGGGYYRYRLDKYGEVFRFFLPLWGAF
jgi:hypothetical protein